MDYRKTGKEIVARLDEDDEIVQSVLEICKKENVETAFVTAIGAVRKVEISHFNTQEKKYHSKALEGMLEVVSLNGNVAMLNGEPAAHLHIVFADSDFSTYGGHLVQGIVNPTLEIVILPLKNKIQREKDEKNRLNLQKF